MSGWAIIAVWYAALGCISAGLYGIDKRRARRRQRRIPESWLHGADVLGGWPGGMLARRVFRHKTRKTRFLVIARLIILLHVLAWVTLGLLARRGA